MIRISVTKLIAFFLLAALLLAGTALGEVSREGLVGEWLFDGDAKDSSGNGNDGTVYGATFVDGKMGKAMSFDGADDYVSVSDSNSLQITNTITLEAWAKFSVSMVNNPIVSKWGVDQAYTLIAGYPIQNKVSGVISINDVNNEVTSIKTYNDGEWHNYVSTYNGSYLRLYVDGFLDVSLAVTGVIDNPVNNRLTIGSYNDPLVSFNGLIDDVRIYNRTLSASEIKDLYEGKQTASTALTITKTASPYSIKQGQTTTITLTIKNTGTTDITNIEVMDSIHRNFDLIGGDFPNPRKFDIIGKGESREIQYMIKAKEGGTFNLDPATGIYADKDGNIQEAKSEPFSVKVITYFEPNPIKTSAPASTPEPTTNPVKTASVSLYGEKTDVVLGEDILLKLSAVNLITKPMMHVQVIIIPPSGMSVTSSEFSKIAAGQFTANYELPPGDGRDIEVSIKSNQIGDFNVNGRIIYYFGDDKVNAEDHNLNLPIKVRKEAGQTVANPTPIPTTPGFAGEVSIIGVLFVALFIRRRKI